MQRTGITETSWPWLAMLELDRVDRFYMVQTQSASPLRRRWQVSNTQASMSAVTDVIWWCGHGTRADWLNLFTKERGKVFVRVVSGVVVRRVTQHVLECLWQGSLYLSTPILKQFLAAKKLVFFFRIRIHLPRLPATAPHHNVQSGVWTNSHPALSTGMSRQCEIVWVSPEEHRRHLRLMDGCHTFWCLSRLRSEEMVTPSKRTWSLALMVSAPSWSEGPLLPSKAEPYLDPAQRRSVLSALSSYKGALKSQGTFITDMAWRGIFLPVPSWP